MQSFQLMFSRMLPQTDEPVRRPNSWAMPQKMNRTFFCTSGKFLVTLQTFAAPPRSQCVPFRL